MSSRLNSKVLICSLKCTIGKGEKTSQQSQQNKYRIAGNFRVVHFSQKAYLQKFHCLNFAHLRDQKRRKVEPIMLLWEYLWIICCSYYEIRSRSNRQSELQLLVRLFAESLYTTMAPLYTDGHVDREAKK